MVIVQALRQNNTELPTASVDSMRASHAGVADHHPDTYKLDRRKLRILLQAMTQMIAANTKDRQVSILLTLPSFSTHTCLIAYV